METIGFSVFRRGVRSGAPARRYTIEIRLPDGSTKQHAGFTDRAASIQLGAKLVREIERREVGMHDQYAVAKRTPLGQHLDAFLVAMANGTLARRRRGKATADYLKRARKRLEQMFAAFSASRLSHLIQADAERWFAERVAAGWSDKTRDDHAALLRQFGSWLVDTQCQAANPYHRLRPTRTGASKTFERHALTVEQIGLLCDAALVRGVQEYAKVNPTAKPAHLAELERKGRERAALYLVAFYTGMRRKELLALVWDSVRLGDEPSIEVRAETAKGKKRRRIEVPSWVGAVLKQVRDARATRIGGTPPALERVFVETSYRHVTEQLKLDAVFARIAAWDDPTKPGRGRVHTAGGTTVDLHALRHAFSTLVAESGAQPRAHQDMMGHADIRTTLETYTHVRNAEARRVVEGLQAPRSALLPVPSPVNPRPALARSGPKREKRQRRNA